YIRVRPLTLFCVRVTPPTLFYTLSLHDALPIFMFLNIRQKAQELIYHEALSNRSILSDKEQRKLAALSSGHAGECEYDRLFDDAGHGSLLIYRDIWMKVDDAVIQADSLIIADGVVAVDEVKNFSGNYKYAGGEWTVGGRPGYEDPLAQVSR